MKSSDVVRALAPADQAGEDEPLSALMYPLRFLGMGLLIAWLCCTHVASIFPGDVFDPALRSAFDTGMRIGDIGTFLAFVLFAPRIGRLSRHKAFSWAAVALTTAGTAAVGLALIPGGVGEAVIIPASIVTAIGGAVLFCLWAEAYSQMGATRTLMYGALSCIAAAAASFLISTMEAPFGVIATALLPLASLACAHLSFRLLPTERAVAKGVHYPIPWKLIVIMAIAGLLSSFSGAFLSATEYVGAIHRVAATGIVGVVILVMAVSKRDRFDARFLAKVGLPVAVVAFAVIPFVAPMQGYIVSVLMRFAYVWFTFFVLLMLANICYRYGVSALWLFGIERGVRALFTLFGRQTEQLLGAPSFGLAGSDAVVSGLVVILVVAATMILFSEKELSSRWGVSFLGEDGAAGDRAIVKKQELANRCQELARSYGLSPREEEVLLLLAQRKTVGSIERELFIANGTAKTHIRHIYRKLDIHSRDELSDLLGLFE